MCQSHLQLRSAGVLEQPNRWTPPPKPAGILSREDRHNQALSHQSKYSYSDQSHQILRRSLCSFDPPDYRSPALDTVLREPTCFRWSWSSFLVRY